MSDTLVFVFLIVSFFSFNNKIIFADHFDCEEIFCVCSLSYYLMKF